MIFNTQLWIYILQHHFQTTKSSKISYLVHKKNASHDFIRRTLLPIVAEMTNCFHFYRIDPTCRELTLYDMEIFRQKLLF